MKKLFALTVLAIAAQTTSAQPAKPSYSYFEGFNLSVGAAQNKTDKTDTSTSTVTSANTTSALAKLNYTFALAYPAKLGVSATVDLKNSKISDNETLAANGISEITVEPGILLLNNSLLYAKVGSYASRYEVAANAARNLSGRSYGFGIKHYVYGQNFIQAEWTQRKADDNTAGLTGVQFKQSSAAVLVGFNF
jgi:hypothetical protein